MQYICSKNHVFSKVLSICPFLLQSNWACQLWCRIQFLQIEKNGALECLYIYEGTMIQRDLQPCLQKPPWMSRWRKHQQPRTEILTKKTSYMPCALSLSFFNYLPLQTYNFAAKPAQPFTSRTHRFCQKQNLGGHILLNGWCILWFQLTEQRTFFLTAI